MMKMINALVAASLAIVSLFAVAQDSKTVDMDQLLEKVKQGHHQDQQINQQRLADFRNNRQQQAQMYADIQGFFMGYLFIGLRQAL